MTKISSRTFEEAVQRELKLAKRRSKRPPRQSEDIEQAKFVEWARSHSDWVVAHIPNEGTGSSHARWNWMKAMGVLPGMPDIILVTPGLTFGVEFKAIGETATCTQLQVLGELQGLGWECLVTTSAEAASEYVEHIRMKKGL